MGAAAVAIDTTTAIIFANIIIAIFLTSPGSAMGFRPYKSLNPKALKPKPYEP